MDIEQRKAIMRQAAQDALKYYNDAQQQIAFTSGFIAGAYHCDVHLLSLVDIRERQPDPGQRVLAVSLTHHDTDDDFECDMQMMRYNKEIFEKLDIRYWVPFALNVL